MIVHIREETYLMQENIKKIKEIKRDVKTFVFNLIKFIINFLLLISSFICSVKLYYFILY